MNNNSVSVPIRKATTAEFIDMNKSAHLIRKAMMPTVKEEKKEEVPKKSKPTRKVPEPSEPPIRHKVATFVEQHFL